MRSFCRKVLDKLIKFGFNDGSEGSNQEPRSRENMFAKFLGPFESYIVSIQSLLIWEKPYISAIALLIVNIAYWVIVTCSRRLYSFVAVVSLIIFLYRVWVYQIWPEIRLPPPEGTDMEGWTPIHPQVFSVPELSQHLNNWWLALCKWYETACKVRRSQPGLFCIVSCGICSLMAIAGHVIPGVVLVYLLVMLMTFGPGLILYVVPNTWWPKYGAVEGQDRSTSSRGSVDQDSELDEFMPEALAETDLTISEQHSIDSQNGAGAIARDLGIEKMVLEATEHEESLSRDLGSFPNLEEEGSEEEEECTMDIPALLVSAAASALLSSATSAATVPSSDSNNGGNNGIHFVASHFKEGSSDSDNEEAFIEGLSFSRASESTILESSMTRPLSMSSQRPLTAPQSSSALPTKSTSKQGDITISGSTSLGDSQTTPSSDLDISEYELVSESELSS